MVIVVIGILFSLVTSAAMHARRGAKRQKARSDWRTIAGGIQLYRQQYGLWPREDLLGDENYRAFSNDNHHIITCLRTNPLGMTFLNEGDYEYDADTNIVSPWREPYVITINANNYAIDHDVGGNVPANSVRATSETMQ